jgi:uncharacterized protein YgbK (DUF1537 family)
VEQLNFARTHVPVFDLDPLVVSDTAALAAGAPDWASGRLGAILIVIAASARPEKVAAVRQLLGRDAAGALTEDSIALIAVGTALRDVRRLFLWPAARSRW